MPLSQSRVLIAGVDHDLMDQLSALIQPLVMEVMTVPGDEAGVSDWYRLEPDLLVLVTDWACNKSLSLLERLREVDPDAVTLLVSRHGDADLLHQLIHIGVDAHVTIPIDALLIKDVMTRCIRDRQRVLDLKMARMVFEVANEGIMITDEHATILAVNPAFSGLTGYRSDEIVGKKTSILASGKHGPDFYRSMWETLLTHGRWSGELSNRRKDGSVYEQWLSIAAVDDELDKPRRYVGLVSDITERKREEAHMRQLAHLDSLSGLPNRILFNDRLQRTLARSRRFQQKFALLYVDIDHFKTINDTWGHAAGDEVIRTVAARMLSVLRLSDTVSRRGGDEFVLILEHIDQSDEAAVIATKLLGEIAQPVRMPDCTVEVSASVGVALFPQDGDDADSLLAAADLALYAAKSAGRACYRLFQGCSQVEFHFGRREMEGALRHGLKDRRFHLHYLPEVSLQSGQVESVEALLRFEHPSLGLLDAGKFLDVAESSGIMPELGGWALSQALLELRHMDVAVRLVIDLSARQLREPDAADRLLACIRQAAIAPERVAFECTESALTGNDQAKETIMRLAEAGCQFSLDDFGVGYCCFSLLSQLPMYSIKIDRSFTREIVDNPEMRELTAALIAFAQRLGVRAVAEGVETAEQLSLLRTMGCDAAQGYFFGRPASIADCWQQKRQVEFGGYFLAQQGI